MSPDPPPPRESSPTGGDAGDDLRAVESGAIGPEKTARERRR